MAYLTRADLLAAGQCTRRAWLHHHPPEEGRVRQRIPREDDRQAVREAARRRFPGGKAVDLSLPLGERLAGTTVFTADPSVPAIFDATFAWQGIVARISILARVEGGWLAAEARSANSVAEAHELELAAVAWVAGKAGIAIRKLQILHLDPDYVRGSTLDVGALFVSAAVKEHDFADRADRLFAVLAGGAEPVARIGPQCGHPTECPFRGHCAPATGQYSVHRLPRAGKVQAELLELGVDDVRKIPAHVRMNPSQQHAVWSIVHDREYIGQGLLPTLRNVRWPLRFLDFEACQPAVPRWPGTSPFEQIPTQWSMHVLAEDGTVTHQAFLHDEDTDPRPAFVQSLVAAVGTEGTITVYSNYEATTLRTLRDRMPSFWSDLEGVVNRIFDMLPVVRDHYYHPHLDGVFSIKAVLPALCPEISYDDLEIADGAAAAQAWLRMVSPRTPAEERAHIRACLLAYSERDTYAMLRVRDALLYRTQG